MAEFAEPFHPLGDARRSLAWALALSLLIHLLLVVGTPRFEPEAPPQEQAPTPITATLALQPPAPPAPARRAAPVHKAVPRTLPPPVEAPAPAAPVEAPPPPAPAEAESAPQEELAPLPGVPYARRPPPPPPSAVTLPESADLAYTLFYGESGFRAGRATHAWRLEGDRYLIRNEIEASGIVSLFYSGQLVRVSEGRLTAHGLRPDRYLVQRGGPDRIEAALFDWDGLTATLTLAGVPRQIGIFPGAQDQVSFIHQLPFVFQDTAQFSLLVVTPRNTEQYEVQVVGRELLQTEAGEIPTVHLRRQAREDASAVDVWLATELYYLPVKLRLRDRKGDVMEQVLSSAKVR